ncbi:MAG: CHRD domain-containing protein [Acidimicrobiales bacterium]
MTHRRLLSRSALLAALVISACGSDQDPALESPPAESTTTTSAVDDGSGPALSGAGTVTIANIELTGAAEVPGPGDDGGDGLANVFLETGRSEICYDIIVNGIGAATAAHIHEGTDGVEGPVVVPLEAPTDGAIDGCAPADSELISRIQADPTGFYVNVHNDEFPDGALRGQLA